MYGFLTTPSLSHSSMLPRSWSLSYFLCSFSFHLPHLKIEFFTFFIFIFFILRVHFFLLLKLFKIKVDGGRIE